MRMFRLFRNISLFKCAVTSDKKNYLAIVQLASTRLYTNKTSGETDKGSGDANKSSGETDAATSKTNKTSDDETDTTAGKSEKTFGESIKDKTRILTATANLESTNKELLISDPTLRSDENSWRSVRNTLILLGTSFFTIATYLIFELGKPPVNENGKVVLDEYSNLPVWRQYILRTLKELDYYKRLIKEPSRDKLLPDVLKYPYYQPPYTVVLELTGVLVHPDWTYQTGWRFKKRPGVDHFLETLHGMYEIVIYTAEQGMTVFPIIEALDPKNTIAYKLVRDATHFVDGIHVKNLDKLNRDLSKVIVVDWNLDAVKFHHENVFHIPRWEGNDNDTTLIDLAAFLRTIAQTEIQDVREVLKYYKNFDNPLETFRTKQQELMEKQESERLKKTSKLFKT